MTRAPQPFRSWWLIALTGLVAAAFASLERVTAVRAPSWPGGAPRLDIAASSVPPDDVAAGLPVLALVMDQGDLDDPERGLLTNVLMHGREWERPGHVAFFDRGRLQFATGAGVRIHGGGSRKTSPRQGFRLYFRREYGARQVPPGVLFGPGAQPLRHLVVHNDVRDARHFANPLAYDIARATGGITPETYPVRFYVNGELYGVYVLTERFDEQFFRSHFGRDDIGGEQPEMDALWLWVQQTRPLTMAAVAQHVDLENLTRWFIATAFCATHDAFQGPGQFLDQSGGHTRWFWVHWDMDESFHDVDLDGYQDLLNRPDEAKRGRNHAEPRSTLLSHLLADDEAYRTYFKRMFTSIMNGKLTPEFLQRRYEHYRRQSRRLGVKETNYLTDYRRFLDRRPNVFWTQTAQWLNSDPAQPMTIVAPANASITIDGEAARNGFTGRFFPDLTVEVRAAGSPGAFVEWRVNGVPSGRDAVLRLNVVRPTEVEAVFAGKPATPRSTVVPPVERAIPPPPAAPLKWVRIPASSETARFSMSTTEVTAAAFAHYAATAGTRMPAQPSWFSQPDHPVINVTWDEAREFCAAQGGRLPTLAEWTQAADMDENAALPPWGNRTSRPSNLLGTRAEDRWLFTSPVASFPPNRYGLYDMVGNVWEWTADLHSTASASYDVRIILGGSWDTPPIRFPRTTGLSRSGRHNLYVGFRCAR